MAHCFFCKWRNLDVRDFALRVKNDFYPNLTLWIFLFLFLIELKQVTIEKTEARKDF